MPAIRFTALLVAVAVLFAQIVAGVHMAGHVHGAGETSSVSMAGVRHPADLTVSEHAALHDEALARVLASTPLAGHDEPAVWDLSCAIYHFHAGQQCVTVPDGLALPASPATAEQLFPLGNETVAHLAVRPAIRGPPTFS